MPRRRPPRGYGASLDPSLLPRPVLSVWSPFHPLFPNFRTLSLSPYTVRSVSLLQVTTVRIPCARLGLVHQGLPESRREGTDPSPPGLVVHRGPSRRRVPGRPVPSRLCPLHQHHSWYPVVPTVGGSELRWVQEPCNVQGSSSGSSCLPSDFHVETLFPSRPFFSPVPNLIMSVYPLFGDSRDTSV